MTISRLSRKYYYGCASCLLITQGASYFMCVIPKAFFVRPKKRLLLQQPPKVESVSKEIMLIYVLKQEGLVHISLRVQSKDTTKESYSKKIKKNLLLNDNFFQYRR